MCPACPGPFVVPPVATARAESGIRYDLERDLKLFHDTVHIENTQKTLIFCCVDEQYLEVLRDPITNVIPDDICHIPDYQNYGEVDKEKLEEETNRVKKMDFNIVDPLSKSQDYPYSLIY